MEIRVENNSCPIYVVKINGSFVAIRVKKNLCPIRGNSCKKTRRKKTASLIEKYKMNKKGLLQMV